MNLIKYISSVKAELTHVTWPSRKTTTFLTVLVIVLSLLTSVFLGFFDFIFAEIIGLFI